MTTHEALNIASWAVAFIGALFVANFLAPRGRNRNW